MFLFLADCCCFICHTLFGRPTSSLALNVGSYIQNLTWMYLDPFVYLKAYNIPHKCALARDVREIFNLRG